MSTRDASCALAYDINETSGSSVCPSVESALEYRKELYPINLT